jgi:hypothetical protein
MGKLGDQNVFLDGKKCEKMITILQKELRIQNGDSTYK